MVVNLRLNHHRALVDRNAAHGCNFGDPGEPARFRLWRR
jgi:hypothetical protein